MKYRQEIIRISIYLSQRIIQILYPDFRAFSVSLRQLNAVRQGDFFLFVDDPVIHTVCLMSHTPFCGKTQKPCRIWQDF